MALLPEDATAPHLVQFLQCNNLTGSSLRCDVAIPRALQRSHISLHSPRKFDDSEICQSPHQQEQVVRKCQEHQQWTSHESLGDLQTRMKSHRHKIARAIHDHLGNDCSSLRGCANPVWGLLVLAWHGLSLLVSEDLRRCYHQRLPRLDSGRISANTQSERCRVHFAHQQDSKVYHLLQSCTDYKANLHLQVQQHALCSQGTLPAHDVCAWHLPSHSEPL